MQVSRDDVSVFVEQLFWTELGRDSGGPDYLAKQLNEFLDWLESRNALNACEDSPHNSTVQGAIN